MSTAVVALPSLMDPMYWIGPGGLFASAVLPGLLVIVFIETGLLFPILPGDSLLFAAGLLAAGGTLNIWALAIAVSLVAIAGDQTAYFIGRRIGPALFTKEDSRLFKRRYVTESHEFFDRRGPYTIVLARFLPIVRTFTPVIAGVSKMRYPVFLGFDVIGGFAWGAGMTVLGYFLGNITFVRNHIEMMILLVGFASIMPGIISMGRALIARRRTRGVQPAPEPLPGSYADTIKKVHPDLDRPTPADGRLGSPYS